MSVPGTQKARPAPPRPERAWAEMPTGRRRWATAPLSGTSSGQTGPVGARKSVVGAEKHCCIWPKGAVGG
jgi:hypothetical protein